MKVTEPLVKVIGLSQNTGHILRSLSQWSYFKVIRPMVSVGKVKVVGLMFKVIGLGQNRGHMLKSLNQWSHLKVNRPMASVWKVKVIGPMFKVIGVGQNIHLYTTSGEFYFERFRDS